MTGLLAVGAVVVLWDAWALTTNAETISGAIRRIWRMPRGHAAVIAAAALLVAHLVDE